MKRQTYLPLLCLFWLISATAVFSAPIQNLKFTDVVKDVKILNVATKAETTAKVGDVLVPPNVIKTGADSRAELVAEDQTVTRVGANTIFSVEANSRDVNIAKGSVLFHSPAGKGGGNIKSAGATASVLGTTLIVGANQAGGFKVMLLEGKGQVSGAGGGATRLNAGQMSFAMPGQAPSQPLNFELKGQVSGSKLVGGFSKPLASIAKIEAAVNVQQTKIASGEMASTGLMIGDSPSVAFKVDAAVVRVTAETVQKAKDAVVRARVAQAKTEAANAEKTRQVLDRRFLAAVSKNLSLTAATTPPTHEAPIPLTLDKLIAGSAATTGNYTIGDDSGWGAPIGIPGNREEKSDNPMGNLTMLLGRNIVFENPTTGQSPDSGIFLIAPMFYGKNYNGVVALENLEFRKSVDFVEGQLNHQGDSTKPAVLENLFLTAGNTITAGAGTVIKSSHATNFDIYAGGTGFSGADIRTGFFSPATGGATPLSLTDTMLWNARNWTEEANTRAQAALNSDGNLSVEGPSIVFRNVTISAGHSQGSGEGINYMAPSTISLISAGSIRLEVDAAKLSVVKSYDLASTEEAKDAIASDPKISTIPLPLGFKGPEALAIQSFNVSIGSSGKSLSLTGVPIYANRTSVSTGSVPVIEASLFIPDSGDAAAYANKLYVPLVKYDRDLDEQLNSNELEDARNALVGKSVGVGGAVPTRTISSVSVSGGGMLELVLDGTLPFNGMATEGSLDTLTSGTFSGTFSSAAVTVGTPSQYSADAKISLSNIVLGGLNINAGSKDPLIDIQSAGDFELKNLFSRTVNGGTTASRVLNVSSTVNWEAGLGVFDVNGDYKAKIVSVDHVNNQVTLDWDVTFEHLDVVSAGVYDRYSYNDFSSILNVDIRAMGSVLMENAKFSNKSNLSVWADQEVTFKGVSIIAQTTDVSAKLAAVSKSKSIYLNTSKVEIDALKLGDPLPVVNNLKTSPTKMVTKTVMQAKAVHFTADNGDIFVNGVSFEKGNVVSGSEFQARAKGTIGIYDSAIDHSKVAIAANTVVLKDVEFSYGSAVDLRSGMGRVAGAPGTGAAVLPGHVNFVANVFYGKEHEIHLPNMSTAGQTTFQNALGTKYPGKDFSKLTIKSLDGVVHP
jgi:hypothetical protein